MLQTLTRKVALAGAVLMLGAAIVAFLIIGSVLRIRPTYVRNSNMSGVCFQ